MKRPPIRGGEETESEPKPEPEPQSNETGGFRFAVTLVAALGTVLYGVANYLQNTAVKEGWFRLVCGLIAVGLILVFYLLLYILIKGYLMEVHDDHKQRERLEDWASSIYSVTFFVFTVLLISLVYVFSLRCLNLKVGTTLVAATVGIFFLVLILCVFVFKVFVLDFERRGKRIKIKTIKIDGIFLVGLLITAALFAFPLLLIPHSSPLQGRVTVEMESVPYKSGAPNDAPIPVFIQVTGPNTNLLITLFKEDSDHNLSRVDNITLKPECNSYKTVSGGNSFLVGNALNYGRYNVFIKTANLCEGYYELRCVRLNYAWTEGVRGFYLLNRSQ